jgi:hypothetical protein
MVYVAPPPPKSGDEYERSKWEQNMSRFRSPRTLASYSWDGAISSLSKVTSTPICNIPIQLTQGNTFNCEIKLGGEIFTSGGTVTIRLETDGGVSSLACPAISSVNEFWRFSSLLSVTKSSTYFTAKLYSPEYLNETTLNRGYGGLSISTPTQSPFFTLAIIGGATGSAFLYYSHVIMYPPVNL